MRTMRGYDLHRNGEVKRAAISRTHKDDFKLIREAHGESLEGTRQANEDIAEVYATEECRPDTPDLEHALKESVTSPREMAIADFVDRRKSRLIRDLDQVASSLKQRQAMRRSSGTRTPEQASTASKEPAEPRRKAASPPVNGTANSQQSLELFQGTGWEAD